MINHIVYMGLTVLGICLVDVDYLDDPFEVVTYYIFTTVMYLFVTKDDYEPDN